MTEFEEEAIKEAEKCGYVMAKSKIVFYEDEKGITFVDFNGTHTNFNFPWLEFAKNWHSDEEFQAKEKEIKRLRKINHLYKKAKGNAERLAVDRGERLNQAQDEIKSLKSQLQHQALPVVKDFVAKWIEYTKEKDNNASGLLIDLDNMPDDVDEWLFLQENDDNINLILRAWLDGYTVEKPQMFYLKNKLTDMYLYKKPLGGYGEEPTDSIKYLTDDFKFTQKEINEMDVQGYDKLDEHKGE